MITEGVEIELAFKNKWTRDMHRFYPLAQKDKLSHWLKYDERTQMFTILPGSAPGVFSLKVRMKYKGQQQD